MKSRKQQVLPDRFSLFLGGKGYMLRYDIYSFSAVAHMKIIRAPKIMLIESTFENDLRRKSSIKIFQRVFTYFLQMFIITL